MKIDRNIPIPEVQKCIYPWKTLEVGDSFLMPGPPKNVNSSVSAAGRRYGRKFSYRKTAEGMRVWRVA